MSDVDETISYVGWGSRTRTVRCDMDLGLGVHTQGGWLRNLVWHAAYGYVSGFRLRDIAYYLATRELSPWIWKHVNAWEERTGRQQLTPWAGGTWAHRHQHLDPLEAVHITATERAQVVIALAEEAGER